MKITTLPQELNLIAIGDIRFDFNRKSRKRKGTIIYVGEMDILNETDKPISTETEKALLKMMKKQGSDLLTDGRDFYTTRGNVITQIRHRKFYEAKEQHKEECHELLYG